VERVCTWIQITHDKSYDTYPINARKIIFLSHIKWAGFSLFNCKKKKNGWIQINLNCLFQTVRCNINSDHVLILTNIFGYSVYFNFNNFILFKYKNVRLNLDRRQNIDSSNISILLYYFRTIKHGPNPS
jgi:hypothetical protein